jgi:glutamate-ammonia-ligase adenylyltransferase
VAWASSPGFAARAAAAIEAKLRTPRDAQRTAADVRAMRQLMARERPAAGFWDLKLHEGGLVDIEFAAQFLQLAHAADGGPLRPNTAAALEAMRAAGLAPAALVNDLADAWSVQQDLSQLVKVALPDGADPEHEPRALRSLMAKAAGVRDFRALHAALTARRRAAHRAFLDLLAAA